MSAFKSDCLAGKVAVITGGGSGICKGIAMTLMQHGCETAIIGRREDVLQVTARELAELTSRQCLAVSADVRDYAALSQAAKRIAEAYGHVDILVNGAAGNFLCALEDMSANGFSSIVDIDLKGTFNASSVFFKTFFQEQRSGTIVNISASLHYCGTLLQAHAGSAKAAVDAFTKHAAVEWGPYNIRVNIVTPGPIQGTEGLSRLTSSAERSGGGIKGLIPLQGLGLAQDVGLAVLFLSTADARYITGANIVVDGGQSLTAANFTILDPEVRNRWLSNAEKVRSRI